MCDRVVVRRCSKQGFQGLVLDMGGLVGMRAVIADLFRFVRVFATAMHARGMELILVLPVRLKVGGGVCEMQS